jgi:hypothetical protein
MAKYVSERAGRIIVLSNTNILPPEYGRLINVPVICGCFLLRTTCSTDPRTGEVVLSVLRDIFGSFRTGQTPNQKKLRQWKVRPKRLWTNHSVDQ